MSAATSASIPLASPRRDPPPTRNATLSAWAAEARQALDRIDEQKRRSSWDEPRFFNDFVDAAQQRNEEDGWRAYGNGA